MLTPLDPIPVSEHCRQLLSDGWRPEEGEEPAMGGWLVVAVTLGPVTTVVQADVRQSSAG